MKRLADKAVMWAVVGAIIVLGVVEVLFVLPDEIRWEAERRREWRRARGGRS